MDFRWLTVVSIILIDATSAAKSLPLRWVDRAYVARVDIGTPARRFDLELRTGSSTLYIYGKGCRNCEDRRNTFNPLKSSSFRALNRTFDELGEVGDVAEDAVKFAGVNFGRLQLGVVSKTEGDVMHRPPVSDGVLGLRLPRSDDRVDMSRLYEVLGSRNFTVSAKKAAWWRPESGLITFGGADTRNCEKETNFVPMNSSTATFQVSRMTVGNFTSDHDYRAVVKAEHSVWVLSRPLFSLIQKAFNGTGNRVIEVPCDQDFPNITLTIGGKPYTIKGELLVSRVGEICTLKVVAMNLSIYNIGVGRQFLYSYCFTTDFDNDRAGFARAK